MLTAAAQNSPQAKASVAKIREMYSSAKNAIGPINDVTHYYFEGDFDEELSFDLYKPYFVSRKFNVGAMEYYQEYLFDDNFQLVFFYEKLNSEPACEVRYYYEKNALVHKIVQGEQTTDEMFALRLANDLIEVFNKMQNRNYD